MFKPFTVALFVCLSTLHIVGCAEESQAQSKDPSIDKYPQLVATLNETLGLDIVSVKPSPLSALFEVVTNQGLFYTSSDGKYLLQGKLYGLSANNVVNHTEESLAQVRIEGMKQFENDMIVYPAKDEKHVITVFTDITCGYCRKLHKQMDDLNDKGITVRYLAYPRAGVKDQFGQYSKGFKDLRSIWCNEKPKEALTNAKLGSNVAQRICDKPIEQEFDFGRQIGVNSTPSIVFSNGFMLPGYKEPSALLAILESMASES